MVAPTSRPKSNSAHGHSVQLYEDDSVLLDGLSPFIGSALGVGGAAIVIATKAHREGLAQRLGAWGIDTDFVLSNGRYVAVDAAEALSKFMVEGWPDEEKFSTLIADMLVEVSRGPTDETPRIALFGEMVSLLWAKGKTDAAVCLERLWNNLAQTHTFDLRCAYPIGGFGQESHEAPFRLICAEHSQVIPAESYTSLVDEDERLRLVTLLQQKAQSFQSIADERQRLYDEAQVENARRRRAEESLRKSEDFTRGILENSVDCLQVMDLEGRLLYTSPAGQRAFQIESMDSPLNGKWMDGWIGEGRRAAFIAALAGGIGNFQGHCATSTGAAKCWDVKVCPLFDNLGQVERLISISHEITELKQMQSALVQAEKLAATGRLAATIAHELNNPLDAVTNLIYLATISGGLSDDVSEYLKMADRELARVSHIAQQTLGFYRDQLHPRRVNISEAIGSVLAIYDRRLQYKRLRVERNIDKGLEINAREGELKQVLFEFDRERDRRIEGKWQDLGARSIF